MSRKLFKWTFLVVLVFGVVVPFALVFLAGTIAERYNCVVNEAGTHPCVVNGQDIGYLLYNFGMLAWLGVGGIAMLMWMIVISGVAAICRTLFGRKGSNAGS
ncbi:MAG: hypothetical protein U0136_07830 [Bdellovibrionota bacterium]